MNKAIVRLRRVARKYAIDRRLAHIALAESERQHALLTETHNALVGARARLARSTGSADAGHLAMASEWSGRLAEAMHHIAEDRHRAQCRSDDHRRLALQAVGQEDLILRRIGAMEQAQAAAGSAAHAAGRRRFKADNR